MEERKMVPIVRLRRQKRTVGVNQLEIEAHVVKIAALMAGAWRERERGVLEREWKGRCGWRDICGLRK